MHIGFALPIFSRETFGRMTNHIILSIPDLARQPNVEDFVGNIKRLHKVFYHVFMNRYILGLEAYWKYHSSKGTAEGKS